MDGWVGCSLMIPLHLLFLHCHPRPRLPIPCPRLPIPCPRLPLPRPRLPIPRPRLPIPRLPIPRLPIPRPHRPRPQFLVQVQLIPEDIASTPSIEDETVGNSIFVIKSSI